MSQHSGFEIHCPSCGPFWSKKDGKKGCPECGNKQAISLYIRDDIERRFDKEKEMGRPIT